MKNAASTLFELAVRLRSFGYDSGLRPVHRVRGIGVISVGNLRVGGSGKTPLAMRLCEQLRDLGVSVALILRGYRGSLETSGGLVSEGQELLVSPEEAGDEATQAALRLTGVTVHVGGDRIAALRSVRDKGAEFAVLDDAFQYRRLHRDLDILLVCPEDLDQKTRLLPAGPLRERSSAASRAQIIGGLTDDWQGRPDAPPLLMEHLPTCLVSSAREIHDLTELRHKAVHVLAGLARPERFLRTVKDLGVPVKGNTFFSDHHPFSKRDLARIEKSAQLAGARAIITTEKDLARISHPPRSTPLFALRIDVVYQKGEGLLTRYLKELVNSRLRAKSSSTSGSSESHRLI